MLFRFDDVHKSYGATEVLRGVTFQVNPGEKVGLVGRNGAGKSTLFKLLCRVEAPDTGQVIRVSGLSIGLLEQHPHFPEAVTIVEAARSVFTRLHAIEADMQRLEHEMAEHAEENDYLAGILETYSELQHEFEVQGGFTYRARVEEVLMGLGFKKDDFATPVQNLSGGQQGRLHLAMLLLKEPDVLLLDEPTNHLDLRAVEWLEEFLRAYKSAYVVISHDRYLLDRVTERTVEIDRGVTTSYTGSFSEYLVKRDAEREIQQRHYENQQEEIARVEEFIRRNLAGQKTKQAKSRRNQLERMERVEAAVTEAGASNFSLKKVVRTGDNVLIVEDLAVGYDGKALVEPMQFTVYRGDRLGIIGGNGAGKTTFLKTVLGNLEPVDGDLRWGTNTQVGYYDQRLEGLTLANTVMGELQSEHPGVTEGELRSFLARFLFRGDDIYKEVRVLSGGERGRLALAKLIYSRANVLTLDEPTNHLDIASCEALEAALDEYNGTCLIVSHDRYFLDNVATRILFLENGTWRIFDGSYTELWEARQAEKDSARQAEIEAEKERKAKEQPVVEAKRAAAPKKKKLRKPEAVEADIAEAETDLEEVSAAMSTPEVATSPELLAEYNTRYEALTARIEELFAEWEEASAESPA
ncbi:MAG: ABC-F family ATP-binding cassette domain-containing protein [Blastocatellia bacterium]|nr:ABC-F family ATP-binding cassette domain-containing protein [Blastocatellia bacterium]